MADRDAVGRTTPFRPPATTSDAVTKLRLKPPSDDGRSVGESSLLDPVGIKPRRFREYVILTTTLALCLGVSEAVARVIVPAPLTWRWPQVRYQPSVSLGFRMAPNQTGFTADKPFSINSMGLRGPERMQSKPDGVRRVLILGDSIAFGYGVTYEDSVAQRLEDLLNHANRRERFEVIDSAVPSFNTTQEVTYFREEGIGLDPDIVVLAVCWNDVSEKTQVSVNDEGFLVQPGAKSSSFDRWSESAPGYAVRNVLKRSRVLYLAMDRGRELWSRLRGQDPPQVVVMQSAVLTGRPHPAVTAGWVEIESRLAELARLCEARGIRLLITMFPMPQALDGRFPHAQYPSEITRMCRAFNLECLDLQPAFAARFAGHTSLFIPYDGDHPNERGHMIAAQSLYAALRTPAVGEGDTRAEH